MGLRISKAKRSSTTKIGGVEIEIKPLSLENALRLTLLLAPYLGRVQHKLPQIQKAIGNGQLLEALLRELAGELAYAPGDIVTAYGLLLDRPPEWIAVNASARELIEVLPLLDEVNDLKGLLQVVSELIPLSEHPPGRPG